MDLHDYQFKETILTYEPLETVCVIPSVSKLVSGLSQKKLSRKKEKKSEVYPVHFLTVGERGIIRIWFSEGAICLYEQKSSDAIISSNEDELKGGFVSAVLQPSAQGVLCVTADQRFLFYDLVESNEDLQALLACPVASIRTEKPPSDILDVHSTFPLPIDEKSLPGIYHCGYHSRKSYGATSYLIKHSERDFRSYGEVGSYSYSILLNWNS